MKLVSLLLPLSFAFSITLAVSNSSFYIQSWSLTFQNVWNDKLDRLWLTSFHTGAGLSDPTFTNNSSLAKKFYINDTVLHMETGGEISWGFVMGPATNYAAWEPVQLNAGAKTPGFYINDTDGTNYQGVRWNSGYPYVTPPGQANQHVGWVSCSWSHGEPQLFWRVRNGMPDGTNFTGSKTCAHVALLALPNVHY